MPERLARAIRSFFDTHIGDSLAYPNDPQVVLDRHLGDGVGAVWNLPYAHKPGMSDDLNAAMAEVTNTFADHDVTVVTGCTAHPADDSPGDTIRRAHELHGARVIKIHCSVGQFDADDDRLAPVYDAAAALSMPVVVHVGHGVSGLTETNELDAIDAAAKRHPDAPIIVAHCGHHGHGETLALMDQHPNLYADLTPVVFERPALTTSEVEAFADRLLLGSDAPNVALTVQSHIDWLHGLELQEETLRGVLGNNAVRLVPLSG